LAALALVTVPAVLYGGAPHAVAAAPDDGGISLSTCQHVAATSVTYLNADGVKVDGPGPDVAAVYHFDTLGDIQIIRPPEGFDPITASDQTLQAWAFTPRQNDDAGLAQWQATYSNYKVPTQVPELCTTTASATIYDNNIWSGVMDTGSDPQAYRRVFASNRVPTFNATCPTPSSLVQWVGIGGWGVPQLIQLGWATDDNTTQGEFPWMEFLSSGYSTPLTPIVDGITASAGDLVESDAYYYITSPSIILNFTNRTTGYHENMTLYSIRENPFVTHPVSEYYNGSMVEAINERPTLSSGGYHPVRNFGTAGWADANAALAGHPYTGMGGFPHVGIQMQTGSGTIISSLSGNAMASGTGFNMIWHSCAT
jgi:hypothetical protein